MMRLLPPWPENINKRQVKSPKIYLRDSGIFHCLLGIHTQEDIESHPKRGASWEGFALEEIIRKQRVRVEDCYFWATQSGAELDLLILKEGKRLGFEIKHGDAPKITPSMKIALEDLKLDHLTIIYPGDKNYDFSHKVSVEGLQRAAC